MVVVSHESTEGMFEAWQVWVKRYGAQYATRGSAIIGKRCRGCDTQPFRVWRLRPVHPPERLV